MKPNWEDAPEWAAYLAMDADGEWYWYEKKPKQFERIWSDGGASLEASIFDNWQSTLEPRP